MKEIKIEKIDEKSFDNIIIKEHYLHRANSTHPAIHYAFYYNNQIVALQEWSAIFKPVLLRFPFLNHLEIIDNSRYLIRKEGNLFEKPILIYNLGSRALSIGIKHIKEDWKKMTGTIPKLLITYIDQSRGLIGTTYKASNWIEIENSAGKNYNKKSKKDFKPTKKKTFIYKLDKNLHTNPQTFFSNSYLKDNWQKLNSVARYNYKPKY